MSAKLDSMGTNTPMPETPKSFEEWSPEEEQRRLQAAADALANNDGRDNERNLVASLLTEELPASLPTQPSLKSSDKNGLPPQTMAGEGELPPLERKPESSRVSIATWNLMQRERQLREAIAQRDGARERLQKVGGRLLFLESVCGFPKTVALGDEELEKLRGQVFNMLVCYKGVRDAWGDDRTVEIEALLGRLRSQDGNQEGQ